jgi:hypothetical protein
VIAPPSQFPFWEKSVPDSEIPNKPHGLCRIARLPVNLKDQIKGEAMNIVITKVVISAVLFFSAGLAMKANSVLDGPIPFPQPPQSVSA